MGYFSYIAEQSFKTSANGQRLFYRGGPWATPYMITDLETEKLLFRKQTWMMRLTLGLLLLSLSVLSGWMPGIIHEPYRFIIFCAIIMAAYWVVGFVVFAQDLKHLKRAEEKLSMKSYYMQMAQKHSKTKLVIGLIGSLLFAMTGLWLLATGENWAAGILTVVSFGLAAFGWGFALNLKFKNSSD